MESLERIARLSLLGMALLAGACSEAASGRDGTRDAPVRAWSSGSGETAPEADGAAVDRPRVVFLGDSLTAGYGLDARQAYPGVLEQRLRLEGYPFEVVNAGVSGDTSAGGLRRLEWSLRGDVAVLVIALGGNDGLRGLPPAELKKNLQAMIDEARARHIDVVLAGMEAPPNFGPAYTREFREVYRELAEQPGVRFVPFLLAGVAGEPALNQPDGIHPNADGQRRVADLVWQALEPLLEQRASS